MRDFFFFVTNLLWVAALIFNVVYPGSPYVLYTTRIHVLMLIVYAALNALLTFGIVYMLDQRWKWEANPNPTGEQLLLVFALVVLGKFGAAVLVAFSLVLHFVFGRMASRKTIK